MAKTIKQERLRWVLPIVEKRVKLVDAASVCLYSKRTLERWVSAYKHGKDLAPRSTRPKTNKRETPLWIQERILELRHTHRFCAHKVKWMLDREGVHLHERTVGKILKREGLTRTYRVRKIRYQYVRVLLQPGELIEIDVKYVPQRIDGKQCFQYTAIDCATRWRYLELSEEQTNLQSILFLEHVMQRFPYQVRAIKTDNHSTFTNRSLGWSNSISSNTMHPHPLDIFCNEHGITHYLIDAGKPQQNGMVERSHRSDQEAFYDTVTYGTYDELRWKLALWNLTYNHTPHCGLHGRSPYEMIHSY